PNPQRKPRPSERAICPGRLHPGPEQQVVSARRRHLVDRSLHGRAALLRALLGADAGHPLSQPPASHRLQGTPDPVHAGGTSTAPTQPTDPLSPGWGANFDPNGVSKIDFSKVPNPTGLGVFTSSQQYKDPVTDRITLGFDRQV